MAELLERGELLARLEAARAEGGRMLFVGGEAGVGKTTLVRAFAAGKPALLGSCENLTTATPLGPFLDVGIELESEPRRVAAELLRELARTPLEGVPSQLLVHPDGRVVVALRDRSSLEVLEPSADAGRALETRCVVATPAEPVGLALTPDRKTLLVASGWGHALTGHDAGSLETRLRVDLPREPRAIVVSDDGARAGRCSIGDTAIHRAQFLHARILRRNRTIFATSQKPA